MIMPGCINYLPELGLASRKKRFQGYSMATIYSTENIDVHADEQIRERFEFNKRKRYNKSGQNAALARFC
jgi:hypothetical protein